MTGAAAGAGAGAEAGAVPVDAGAVSLLAGSGAVAGAGAAGVVSVGFVVLAEGCSVVAVGAAAASSFLAFFLPNMPLKAFFSWSIASGAAPSCQFSSLYRRAASRVTLPLTHQTYAASKGLALTTNKAVTPKPCCATITFPA